MSYSACQTGPSVSYWSSQAGALDGRFVNATPFQRCDSKDAGDPVAEFGAALEAAGFARHGGETMISGITGCEFKVDIFVGLVYYQRLRHMVSDKFQVGGGAPRCSITGHVYRCQIGGTNVLFCMPNRTKCVLFVVLILAQFLNRAP
jgi:DNA-directed RNA polymerase I subunit RPA2